MGNIIEKRKYIRISLQGKVIKDIGLESNIGNILYKNKLITCIVANISISGALLSIKLDKKVQNISDFKSKETLVLTLKDSFSSEIIIPGEIVYIKDIKQENRIGIGVEFKEKLLPIKYETLLEEFWNKAGL